MDPVTEIAAAVVSLGGIAATVLAYIKWKRGVREKLGQAEADELKRNMDRVDSGIDFPERVRVDKAEP